MKYTRHITAVAAVEQARKFADPQQQVGCLRGDRYALYHVDYVKDLVESAQRIAFTCGPMNFDLMVIDNAGTVYFFEVPHPTHT